jgi:hypothetical protein
MPGANFLAEVDERRARSIGTPAPSPACVTHARRAQQAVFARGEWCDVRFGSAADVEAVHTALQLNVRRDSPIAAAEGGFEPSRKATVASDRPPGLRFPALFGLYQRQKHDSEANQGTNKRVGRNKGAPGLWLALSRSARTRRQPTRLALTLAVTAALIAPAIGRDLDRSAAKTHDAQQHQRASAVKYFRSPDGLAERDRGDDDRGRCLPPVSGLGKQWVGLKGALDAARKDWMERVRYDHGEIFVDMSHAARVGSRCSRVSIGSFLGRVMYRCEVVARPCKARFDQGAARTASLDAPQTITPPPPAPPPQTAAPRKIASPLAVWKRLTRPLRRHDYRAAPAAEPTLPPDQRPLSVRHATLFIGHIVMGALGTMELAPTSGIAYAHELLNAMAEFPILYRALAINAP